MLLTYLLLTWFQKWHEEFDLHRNENLYFDVLVLSIDYKVSAKTCRRMISQYAEEWYNLWRKTDFLFQQWHEEFGEI